jgi:hypothetical protein
MVHMRRCGDRDRSTLVTKGGDRDRSTLVTKGSNTKVEYRVALDAYWTRLQDNVPGESLVPNNVIADLRVERKILSWSALDVLDGASDTRWCVNHEDRLHIKESIAYHGRYDGRNSWPFDAHRVPLKRWEG